MLLSANMIRLYDVFGMKETFELFSRVGIEGMDFNNDVPQYRSDTHGEDFYRQLAAHAAQFGITICQAHAPFPASLPLTPHNAVSPFVRLTRPFPPAFPRLTSQKSALTR